MQKKSAYDEKLSPSSYRKREKIKREREFRQLFFHWNHLR
ncbi:hypothetical protein BSM4216_2410 [Bacillus smithii]|nr:hypothetical protein BSM4216_2410 [Bacillus smithii]